MAKKNVKSEEPKKKRPISLNILEIAKRLEKVEETGGGGTPYTLPTASADTKGGVKIGTGLSMNGEVLSADAVGASDVSYDNTTSGLSATTVQGAIDEVAGDVDVLDSNLDGFKFYPTGTAIVGLVSDDSAYTDVNGNYVLANSTTGQSMIDDVTYKSINSAEDCRGKVGADSATPFKSGVVLEDINPNKEKNDIYMIPLYVASTSDSIGYIPIRGYSKIAISLYDNNSTTATLQLVDSQGNNVGSSTNLSDNWTSYIGIPSNVTFAKVLIRYPSQGRQRVYYSLLA